MINNNQVIDTKMRQLCRQLFRFSTQESVKPRESGSITTAEQKFQETPIHLRAYDKSKYQVPMKKIKRNSGYALLQIEPFPRGRIMKICYNILQSVKVGIPEDFADRIFLQQRTKYIMEMTDKIEDIEELQDFFGTDSIELMITGLARNLEYVELIRKHKLWELKPTAGEYDLLGETVTQHSVKFPIYKKGERPSSKLIDA